MFCTNCGAEIADNVNFCAYCGTRLATATVSNSLISKAAYTAQQKDNYSLVLVSRGTCDAVMAGDLLEDVFGYTDAESGNLVQMVPVVVAENLTAEEAATIAQMYTEYGMEVSVTDEKDQYVDLGYHATDSVFDMHGNLLAGAAAVIGALTVANRISSYRRFRKPSFIERIFRLQYKPKPPKYQRNFRPRLDPQMAAPRKAVRKPAAVQNRPGMGNRNHNGFGSHSGSYAPGGNSGFSGGHGNAGNNGSGHGGMGGHGGGPKGGRH